MKTVSFILIMFGLSLQVDAQLGFPIGFNRNPGDTAKKIDYSFSTGTSFFSSPGTANGSSFYLAPEFNFKLSPKFKVDAGVMLMQNRIYWNAPASIFGEKSVVVKSGPSYNGMAYASGNYQLNSKLTLSGSLMKSFSPDGANYQMGMQNSFQMMSVNVNYKISEHVSIGGGVHMIQSNGFNPYSGYNYLNPGTSMYPMNNFGNPVW